MTEPMFEDDRTALRDHVVLRRQEGAEWREISKETGGYYIYYLKGISPRSVGGNAPDDFDPSKPYGFMLEPHDALALPIIQAWIASAEQAGVNPDKIARAMRHYIRIRDWQEAHPDLTKIPD